MSYTKKTWVTGDTITAAALNNMENGIKGNDETGASLTPVYVPFVVSADGQGMSISTTAEYYNLYWSASQLLFVVKQVDVASL